MMKDFQSKYPQSFKFAEYLLDVVKAGIGSCAFHGSIPDDMEILDITYEISGDGKQMEFTLEIQDGIEIVLKVKTSVFDD